MTIDATSVSVSLDILSLLNCVWVHIVYSGCIVSRVALTSKESLLLIIIFLDNKSKETLQILGRWSRSDDSSSYLLGSP